MRLDGDLLRDVLTAGIQAPSAENRHCFRYVIEPDRVLILATEQAAWASLPHRRMLTQMALGAAIENIALKSLAAGHAVDVDLRPGSAPPEVVARLQWRPAAPGAADPLALAIDTRHTNRRLYGRQRADAATLENLRQAAAAVDGAALRWLDTPPLRACALKTVRIAETERFRRPALHEELFGAIRFEVGWQSTVDEWLPPAALEVEPPARALFAMLRDWKRMRLANLFGAHLALGMRAGYLPCATAPHLGLVLATADDDRAAAILAGRALQRVWLAAAAAGLALQPMAAATALARQAPGDGWVSARTRARLRSLLASLGGDARGQPHMLFRLGHARAPTAIAGRKPLHHYLD